MSPHGRAVRFGSIVLLVGVLLNVPFGSTQGPADSTPSADIHEKQAILLGIQRSIAQLEGALQATQEELRSPQGGGRREELTQRIKTLGGKLAQLQEDFNEVATGSALEQAPVKPAEGELDWRQRTLELLSPVLTEVRRLTTRPRELSHLRTQIEPDQELLGLAQRALDRLDQLTRGIADPALAPDLQRLRQAWEARQQDLTTCSTVRWLVSSVHTTVCGARDRHGHPNA